MPTTISPSDAPGSEAPLAEYLETQRVAIDRALAEYLPTAPDCPAPLADALRYSLLAGGKRLRPILTLAAAGAIDPHAGAALALPAACAVEMIHTYSLVHDDLPAMDDDTLRRGQPTVHVAYGEALAILAGDALLTEAFSVVARWPASGEPAIADRKLRAAQRLAAGAGAAGMVGGQALDMQPAAGSQEAAPDAAMAALRDLHGRKTGALIRAAAGAGAIMAGASREALAVVDTYAAHLGLGFQIVDDILDVEGETAALGKTAGKDAATGKTTYPSLIGLEASRAAAARAIAAAHETLDAGGLRGGRLSQIADWVLTRKH